MPQNGPLNFLVTGGSGFVGMHVVKGLVEDNERVWIYDQRPDPDVLNGLLGPALKEIGVIRGDITQADHILHTCRDYNISNIIHTAAVIGSENPALTTQVNCNGTVNVLEAAKTSNVQKIVVAGSVAVFGSPERYQQEYIPNDAPHYPSNIYGASKSFGETCVDFYNREYGLDALVVRLTHVYGFGRRSKGFGTRIDKELFIKPALGKPGRVPMGDDIHNFMYVKDAARALIMASRVGNTKTRAFTATGDIASTAQVAELVRSALPGADIQLLSGGVNWAYKFDTEPIRSEIGYQPKWSIKKGVADFIEEIQQGKKKSADNQ